MIFDAPNTKKNRIAAYIAIALGLCVGLYFSLSEKNNDKSLENGPEGHVISNFIPPKIDSITLEDIDFSSYSEELAKFVGLENGEESWAAVDKMRLYFAPEDGETILQTKTSTFDRPDGSVMIYTVSGLRDDSVKAQELFMIFSGEKGAQVLAAHGLKNKCQRGRNTEQWTTELCP